jgi:serine protease Do
MDEIILAVVFLVAGGAACLVTTVVYRVSLPSTAWRFQPLRSALAAGALCALVLPVFTIASEARGPESIPDVTEQVINSVVSVSSTQRVRSRRETQQRPALPNDPQQRRGQGGGNDQGGDQAGGAPPQLINSLGSGFIIDTEGIVVTNNHVIGNADEIMVVLNDGSRFKADLIGADNKVDLAVLRIKTNRKLKPVKFGDSDKLRVGDWVIAIGNPFSLGGSVSAGIVSARNRDISSGTHGNYIQTDATINQGNSGGPLFNLDGEVVGIITAIASPTGGSIGIGFATPSKAALAIIEQLRQSGETRRGSLGVSMRQVTAEDAERLDIKPAHGALVLSVDDKGPARSAGIEAQAT